jgi:outer membrane lipoprotein-sorting protein
VDILVVPPLNLASAYIIQPDALADNIIVMDGAAVYNYTFLTNQVIVFDADDPDALGGLLPAGEDGESVNFNFDLGAIFAGFDASVVEVFDGEFGETYRLQFANKDPSAAILDVMALVPSSDWLPRTLVFMQANGHVLAELHANQLETNTGLDPDYVRDLPSDAEVIDNRR